MERAAFLIENTGERIGCMLNPESIVMRRSAGVQQRRSLGGQLTGVGLKDDPLLYTGGGRTELELELLFDVTLAGSTINTDDVRHLTQPFWQLAENSAGDVRNGRPPVVRFVWGKSMNMPGVVASIAERLEYFTEGGAPRRSWVHMLLVRVNEAPAQRTASVHTFSDLPPVVTTAPSLQLGETTQAQEQLTDTLLSYETHSGGNATERNSGEPLYILAFRHFGNPLLWRLIASFNNIDDPTKVEPGTLLTIPPAPGQEERK